MDREPTKGSAAIFVITLIAMFFVGGSPSASATLPGIVALFAVVAIGTTLYMWNEGRNRRER